MKVKFQKAFIEIPHAQLISNKALLVCEWRITASVKELRFLLKIKKYTVYLECCGQ